jgi:hypothetical protein
MKSAPKTGDVINTKRFGECEGKRIVAIVDAPEISLTEDEKAGDVLIKFYRALGWNGEDILEPVKVRTTEAVYKRLYSLMYEKYSDSMTVGCFMVNKAPGVDYDLPPEKVYLLEGWIRSSES